MKERTATRRMLAFILVISVTTILLYLTVFVGTHEFHHCTGENCPICRELHIVERLEKQFHNFLQVFQFGIILFLIRSFYTDHSICFVQKRNPILDKVRMDD